jgi:hypothetical protein
VVPPSWLLDGCSWPKKNACSDHPSGTTILFAGWNFWSFYSCALIEILFLEPVKGLSCFNILRTRVWNTWKRHKRVAFEWLQNVQEWVWRHNFCRMVTALCS